MREIKSLVLALMILSASPAFTQIRSATLVASGLTCSMCSKSIFKALEKVPSVKSLDVDVEKSEFKITFKPDGIVSLDEVKDAVEDAGFSVATMEVVIGFAGETASKDAHITSGGSMFHFVGNTNKKLTGDVTVRLLDKDFISRKEHDKYGKLTKMKCYETGKAEACCPAGTSPSKRIYHVSI